MTYFLEWRNADKTILARVDGNHTDIIEPNHSDWNELSSKGNITPFQPPITDLDGEVRGKRNQLLAASDWTQIPDAPVDQAVWATYRQALRDVPQQEGFPENVIWPTPPSP